MSQKKSQPPIRNSANYYLVKPKSGKGRQVLVLHAWWGLNEFIKDFCNRLAKEGFVVLAPDLYHGAVASTIEQAENLSSNLKQDVVAKEITQAARQLQAISGTNTREIGVIGFSLGGYWALWLADQKPNPVVATVVFYATRNDDYAQSHSAFQFHLAETDDYEPTSKVKKLEKSLRVADKPAEFYSYAGTTHWFFERDRADAYHAESAKLAWNRTVDFLKVHVSEM
ncbi:MAG: dienelactone hydrolase family protein [Chloroflexi bacterium]|nr:dienelactone hydrolase family protein [Chloroflexota bacterium]